MEPFYKPVPKPRTKAVDKLIQLAKNQRHTVFEANAPSKDSTSDSTHENFECVSGESSLYETHPSECDGPFNGDCEDSNFNSDAPFGSAALAPQ